MREHNATNCCPGHIPSENTHRIPPLPSSSPSLSFLLICLPFAGTPRLFEKKKKSKPSATPLRQSPQATGHAKYPPFNLTAQEQSVLD
jgi:hypothetical protein